MRLEELRHLAATQFKQAGKDYPERDVDDLIGHVLNISWSEIQLKKDLLVTEQDQNKVLKSLEELILGKPLAYILGERAFYKYNFFVNESVLIPRPETELLVEESIHVLGEEAKRVFDLGAGSGCIGLSIAKDCPEAKVWLFEKDKGAADVCLQNKVSLSVSNAEIVQAEVNSVEPRIEEHFSRIDLIVSNPPYIAWGDPRVAKNVHKYEPHLALYAQDNGLNWIHNWLIWGYNYLKEDGLFMFEFGEKQEEQILPLVEKLSYSVISLIKDYNGKNRFIKLKKVGI